MMELTLQLNGKTIGLIRSSVVPRVGEFISVPARDLPGCVHPPAVAATFDSRFKCRPPGQKEGFVAFEVKEVSYQVTSENVVCAILVDIEQI